MKVIRTSLEAGQAQAIYCGPNLPNGALLKYTVYKDGFPENLEAIFQKCPEIKELFIPLKDLKKVQAEIKEPGTFFYRLYQVVQKYIREEQSK